MRALQTYEHSQSRRWALLMLTRSKFVTLTCRILVMKTARAKLVLVRDLAEDQTPSPLLCMTTERALTRMQTRRSMQEIRLATTRQRLTNRKVLPTSALPARSIPTRWLVHRHAPPAQVTSFLIMGGWICLVTVSLVACLITTM